MKQLEEGHFQTDENKIFVRTSDGIKFGTDMYLATNDSIENYDEVVITEKDKELLKNLQEEHNRMHIEMEEKFGNKNRHNNNIEKHKIH